MKKIVFLMLSIFLVGHLHAKNSFLVAPTRTVVSLDRPQTKSFIVTNNGEDTIRVKVKPVYFKLGSKNLRRGTNLYPETASNDNLAPFIRVSPRVVSLKPGTQRSVRISVRPTGELKEGEYRAHLLFQMLEIASVMKTKPKNNKSIGMELSFQIETAVAVYGRKGTGQPKMETKCSLNKDGKLNVTVTNTSPWRFDGWFKVASARKSVSDKKIFMVRESRNNFLLDWKPKQKDVEFSWVLQEENKFIGKSTCSLQEKNTI